MKPVRKFATIIAVHGARMSENDVSDPAITFEVETEAGEFFEVPFSLKSMLMMSIMALGWEPLRSELSQLAKPGLRHGQSRPPLVLY